MNPTKLIIILLLSLLLLSSTANADWVESSTVSSGLGDLGLRSNPEVYYDDGTWKLIAGGITYPGYDETWYSAYLSGTVWVPDQSIRSGLNIGGEDPSPSVFEMNNKLYLISGRSDGTFYGFELSGASWISNVSIVNGLPTTGVDSTFSSPTVYNDSGTWKLISGSTVGISGFYWNGTTWINDANIVSGLPNLRSPDVFDDGGTFKIISGEYHGRYYGYVLSGGTWVSTPSLVVGLPSILDIGYRSTPSVFFDVAANVWKIISGNDDGNFRGYVIDEPPVTSSLLTESQVDPIAVPIIPSFSWTYYDADSDPQSSYQIYVGTTLGAFDMWDSGYVLNSSTTHIYSGAILTRGNTYYVQARTNDEYVWSNWDTGTFVVNLLPNLSGELIETTNNEIKITFNASDSDGTVESAYVKINGINYDMVNTVGDTWEYTNLITVMSPGIYEVTDIYAQDDSGEWGFKSTFMSFEVTSGEIPVVISINNFISPAPSSPVIHAIRGEVTIQSVITNISTYILTPSNWIVLIFAYIGVVLGTLLLKGESIVVNTLLGGTLTWIAVLAINFSILPLIHGNPLDVAMLGIVGAIMGIVITHFTDDENTRK